MTNERINKPFQTLVTLLRLAISEHESPQEAPAAEDWRDIYRLAKKHAVLAIAWDGVEHLQQQAPEVLQLLPADLMGKWFADVQSIEAANKRLAQQTNRVQELLFAGGYNSLLLKGASLAAYYPAPEHRQSADIDLWVPSAANGSLRTHRQTLANHLLHQSDISVGEIVYHHIETTYHGTEVEFHVTPTWLCNPVHNSRLQQIFAQTDHLTPELQELYTLLHAFRHIYHDGLTLRHMLDYWLVRKHNRTAGIPAPTDCYNQLGLSAFANAMDEVTSRLFNPELATPQPLSLRAEHLLCALPQRRLSARVRWDYPAETLCALPWRTIHYLWRKWHHY